MVYAFAWKAIEAGRPEPAAAAVICFEWLQRPENVLAGCITWPDYRGRNAPTAIKVEHHKTSAMVWHPLEEATDTGVSEVLCRCRSGTRATPEARRAADPENQARRRRRSVQAEPHGEAGPQARGQFRTCRRPSRLTLAGTAA